MKIVFTAKSWDDYVWWTTQDRSQLDRLNALIEDITRHPFVGIGKPEPLKGELKGLWSRRITKEHRLVYQVEGTAGNQTLIVIACRSHYSR